MHRSIAVGSDEVGPPRKARERSKGGADGPALGVRCACSSGLAGDRRLERPDDAEPRRRAGLLAHDRDGDDARLLGVHRDRRDPVLAGLHDLVDSRADEADPCPCDRLAGSGQLDRDLRLLPAGIVFCVTVTIVQTAAPSRAWASAWASASASTGGVNGGVAARRRGAGGVAGGGVDAGGVVRGRRVVGGVSVSLAAQ